MQNRFLFTGVVSLLCLMLLPGGSYGQDDGPARKLINSQGCKACHTLEGDGGTLAGSFEAIRTKLSRAEVRQQLVNQEQKHGNSKIPDFSHLSEEELEALVNFLKPPRQAKD